MRDVEITIAVLLRSARWRRYAASFDVIPLAKVGAIDMSPWSPDDHRLVREWAQGRVEELPKVIDDYGALVRAEMS